MKRGIEMNITKFDFKELDKFDKIFVLVSGGIDSTYLFEKIKQECENEKVYAVNCWNPYENSPTLEQIREYERFIEVRPFTELDYKQILTESFMKIPEAIELRKRGKYQKKVFPCCRLIKHQAFFDDPMFKEPNTVVVSGIKYGDGMQRRLWLQSLKTGKTTTKGTVIIDAPTYYHKHKGGQLYCYPFRDYRKREFSESVMDELKKTYPKIRHSGCAVCPVLVLFQDKIKDEPRLDASMRFWNSLNDQNKLDIYMVDSQ
jgi:hypothetical protein